MKKWITVLLVGALAFSTSQLAETVEAASSSVITVLVDGRKVKFQGGDPVMENNRVQVPLRGIGESLGAKVDFSEKTVTYLKGEKSIILTIGSKVATVDGQNVTMDTAAKAVRGRTYVPLRFVSENLGESVSWDQVGNWVWIGEKVVPTLEEVGLKPVSIDPYLKWFKDKEYLLKRPREDITYEKVLIFKEADLPTKFLREIYSVELFTEPTSKAVFLKVRAKTTSTAGNLFYLTNKNDIRFRNHVVGRTINNGDGTKYDFYPIWSLSDKTLDGIIDQKILELSDIEYIGFDGGKQDYIPLMINPWKVN
ncbi:copper amine oxidase N-terminal domain-containing protein [Paenibacillus fonticola]|uniref:copper amine oxidase N-terminal domain-containing protein n=1 Tax=Paenibacillus fonticola TaxID=379896 RepID=UPI00036A9DFA|nr:copper amine oxidase N-terminal domain-containing protein [Paenibacillus fonticola]